jgi:hypothetical protein
VEHGLRVALHEDNLPSLRHSVFAVIGLVASIPATDVADNPVRLNHLNSTHHRAPSLLSIWHRLSPFLMALAFRQRLEKLEERVERQAVLQKDFMIAILARRPP